MHPLAFLLLTGPSALGQTGRCELRLSLTDATGAALRALVQLTPAANGGLIRDNATAPGRTIMLRRTASF